MHLPSSAPIVFSTASSSRDGRRHRAFPSSCAPAPAGPRGSPSREFGWIAEPPRPCVRVVVEIVRVLPRLGTEVVQPHAERDALRRADERAG